MMGDKLRVTMWDVPEDGNEWYITVHPDGKVEVRTYDPITKLKGEFEFPPEADVDFVKGILYRVGFKPKVSK